MPSRHSFDYHSVASEEVESTKNISYTLLDALSRFLSDYRSVEQVHQPDRNTQIGVGYKCPRNVKSAVILGWMHVMLVVDHYYYYYYANLLHAQCQCFMIESKAFTSNWLRSSVTMPCMTDTLRQLWMLFLLSRSSYWRFPINNSPRPNIHVAFCSCNHVRSRRSQAGELDLLAVQLGLNHRFAKDWIFVPLTARSSVVDEVQHLGQCLPIAVWRRFRYQAGLCISSRQVRARCWLHSLGLCWFLESSLCLRFKVSIWHRCGT